MNFSEISKRKKPRVRSVEIVLDEALIERRDSLYRKISAQQRLESWADSGDMASPLPGLQQELLEVFDAIEDAVVEFVFRAIPRNDWNEAIDRYTDDDGKLSEEFEIFVVSASSHDPKMSETQVREMYASADWSAAETDQLFTAAYKVNREVRDIPFMPAGTSAMLSSGLSSTTAPNEE